MIDIAQIEVADVSLYRHNIAEFSFIAELYDREKWLLSERYGYDITTTLEGRMLLELRVCELMPEFGIWMAQLSEIPKVAV
jgi:hypothetical protein